MSTSFADRMRRRGDNVESNANRVLRRTALAILTEVVLGTPVDEGRARSNWAVGLGAAPLTGGKPPHAPGKNLGIGEGANARATIAAGSGVIGNARPGQAIFISNHLPYIGRLNDGYSAQAPAGFVETAVLSGTRVARKAGPLAGKPK